jgi:hypothetical protein
MGMSLIRHTHINLIKLVYNNTKKGIQVIIIRFTIIFEWSVRVNDYINYCCNDYEKIFR